MKILCLTLSCLFLLLLNCTQSTSTPPDATTKDIMAKLEAIPGLTVTEIATTEHFERLFEVSFTQDLDHNNPGGPTFEQKIYIGHVDEALPVVFETEGYSRDEFRTRELAPAMQCNQISVEHRFNGFSRPSPTQWEYLTIKQAADDLHKIVVQLQSVYPASWVSSGRSKGGMTALFHRRFYPEDVDATVAYVAPLLFSSDDERIADYLDNAGDAECRNRVVAFQRLALTKSDSVAQFIPGFVSWVNDNFDTDFNFSVSHVDAIKHAAKEYPFEFWSSTLHDCSTIPDSTANAEEIFNHIIEVVDILLFYSDYGIDFWQGWYYQARTEIGDISIRTDHIDDLLGELDNLADIYDFGTPLVFDPSVMQDIDNWAKTQADRIIYIYGEADPWTAAPFEVSGLDVLKLINPGTKHETAIASLSPDNQELVKQKLSDWLDYQDIIFSSGLEVEKPIWRSAK